MRPRIKEKVTKNQIENTQHSSHKQRMLDKLVQIHECTYTEAKVILKTDNTWLKIQREVQRLSI